MFCVYLIWLPISLCNVKKVEQKVIYFNYDDFKFPTSLLKLLLDVVVHSSSEQIETEI